MSDRTTLPPLVLASSSPQRRALLTEAGYTFEVIAPDEAAECGVCSTGGPAALVSETALAKARDVRPQAPGALLIACDTVAECRGQILGKPANLEHARAILTTLSGRQHRVLSGLCLWRPDEAPQIRVAVTTLTMQPLSDEQLQAYLESHAWEGKAGAFGYQDGLDWVQIVEGSVSNVIGLPMELLTEMLSE